MALGFSGLRVRYTKKGTSETAERGASGIYGEEGGGTDRVGEWGRQRNKATSQGKIDSRTWQIDWRRDKVGSSRCRIKERGCGTKAKGEERARKSM